MVGRLSHIYFFYTLVISLFFRGQMISQEDYNFITRLDNSSPEQRIQLLKEKSYQVINLFKYGVSSSTVK